MFSRVRRPLLLLEKESLLFGPTTRTLYWTPVCSVGDKHGSAPTQKQDSGALKGQEAGNYREGDVNDLDNTAGRFLEEWDKNTAQYLEKTSKRTGVWERYRSKYDQNAMSDSTEKRKAFEAWNNEQIKVGKQHPQESTAKEDLQSQPHNQKGPWNKVRMVKPSKLPPDHFSMWQKKFEEAAKRKQMKISKMQKTAFNKKKRDHMEKLKKFLVVQHENKAKEFEHRLKRKAHIANMRQQEAAKIVAELQKCRGHDK